MRSKERCRATTVLVAAVLCVLGCSGESRGSNQTATWPAGMETPVMRPNTEQLVNGIAATEICGAQGERCGTAQIAEGQNSQEQVAHVADDNKGIAVPQPKVVEAAAPSAYAPWDGIPTPEPRPSELLALAASASTAQGCGAASVSCGSVSNVQPQPVAVVSDPLRNKVGQMLIMGFQGKRPNDPGVQRIASYLERRLVGGVLIGRHNVQSRDQVRALIRYLRKRAGNYKPFFAVDQEGGLVQRLNGKAGYTPVPRASKVAQGGSRSAQQIYRNMARELADTGINMNLGPVVDLNINPRNPIIAKYGRSYGRNADDVTEFAGIFILAHRDRRIATVAKHFPGHGSSTKDTHVAFTDVTNTFDASELEPYRQIGNGISAVMTAHVAHAGITGSAGRPASLSRQAIEGKLRGELQYDNVVMTDDMEMAAVRNKYGLLRAAVMAVNAGNDMLIFSNTWKHNPSRADRLIDTIVQAVQDGTVSRQRIEAASQRINRLRREVR